jgi:hypothetical protein
MLPIDTLEGFDLTSHNSSGKDEATRRHRQCVRIIFENDFEVRIFPKVGMREDSISRDQGCQIFLGATYQNGKKYTK